MRERAKNMARALLSESRGAWKTVFALVALAATAVVMAWRPGRPIWLPWAALALLLFSMAVAWLWSYVAARRYADVRAGRAALNRGDLITAETSFRRALERARTQGDLTFDAAARSGLAGVLAMRGDHVGGLRLCEAILGLFRGGENLPLLGRALVGVSGEERWLGRFDESQRHAEEAVTLARSIRDRDLLARALGVLGAALVVAGDYAPARSHLEEALSIHTVSGDRSGSVAVRTWLGLNSALTGDVDRGVGLLREAQEIAAEYGDRLHAAAILTRIAFVTANSGGLEAATSSFRRLVATCPEPCPDVLPEALVGLARLAAARGKSALSVRLIASADAVRERYRLGNPKYLADAAEPIRREAGDRLDADRLGAAIAEGKAMSGRAALMFGVASVCGVVAGE